MDDQTTDEPQELHSCGYVEDSFACRIRHVAVMTGNTEARKHDKYLADVRQEKTYGI